MEVFQSILRGAVESGASDVHLKTGAPVIFRISGELVSVEAPQPTIDVDEKRAEGDCPAGALREV